MLYLLAEDGTEIDDITATAFKIAEGKALSPTKGVALAIRGLWLMRSGDVANGTEMTERGLGICEAANYAIVHTFVRSQLVLQTLRQGGGAPSADTLAELLVEYRTRGSRGLLRTQRVFSETGVPSETDSQRRFVQRPQVWICA
jgi:hypothetical protein